MDGFGCYPLQRIPPPDYSRLIKKDLWNNQTPSSVVTGNNLSRKENPINTITSTNIFTLREPTDEEILAIWQPEDEKAEWVAAISEIHADLIIENLSKDGV